MRASYLCSYCKCSTVGPSDEASNAVTMVGVAAHIAAAAPGSGARRYDPDMTPSERSHIDNGIWLCGTCSVLIDRDERRFSVSYLKELKYQHEASRRIHGQGGTDSEEIIAIGPHLIAVGSVMQSNPEGTRVRISHFLRGTIRDLWSLSQDLNKWPHERRYVLLNELGYGGLMVEAPSIERTNQGYEVQFTLQAQIQRRDTNQIKTSCANTLKMLTGLEACVQIIESTLGMACGTWFADLEQGTDVSDLYWRYFGSPWFSGLVMMEMIRLSSVPSKPRRGSDVITPMACVNRINRVEVPTFDLINQRLSISVDIELEGIGNWKGMLSIYISTAEDLLASRESAAKSGLLVKPTQKTSVTAIEVSDPRLIALIKSWR
ncbi:hypothetical protein [Pseudomonas sp. HMWF006]|uniref:hypothetical protein n=1 Tax=Pseudomonas sp. HMWF006 TaxID=2056843 RepID=UPI002114F9A1|nr:hypothetical protein [Pseudomonas sp. HMWF006]